MKHSNLMTRTTIVALACVGLAFGCSRNNGENSGIRDDAKTSDTYSGSTSSVNDTTTAPAVAPAPATDTTATTNTTTTAAAPTKKMHHKKHHMKHDSHVGMYNEQDHALSNEAGVEVANPNDVSTDTTVNDDTISGTSQAPADMNQSTEPVTTAPATTSASDEDLKAASRMAGNLSPWYQEPYDRIPTHVGRPTGLDKSMAALESYTVFIDPPALERAMLGRDAIRPVTEVDFNSFDFDKRYRFASQMNSRLENIDSRMNVLESKAHASTTYGQAHATDEIATIQRNQNSLESQLADVRKVDESQWVSFRDNFRDRLTTLERDVAHLSVSLR